MSEAFIVLLLFTFLGVIVSLFLLLETGNSIFFLLPVMIFVFGVTFIGIDEMVIDEMSDYSKDDIFRVMISTDNDYRNVIIEYKDVSWDWLSDNEFIDDNGKLNRNSFFWERVVRDAGVNDVNEVFVNLEVR